MRARGLVVGISSRAVATAGFALNSRSALVLSNQMVAWLGPGTVSIAFLSAVSCFLLAPGARREREEASIRSAGPGRPGSRALLPLKFRTDPGPALPRPL